jgi:hypothetical protein
MLNSSSICNISHVKISTDPTATEIWSANWDILATFLECLWKSFHVQPNEELKQLVTMLSKKLVKGEERLVDYSSHH